VASVGQMEDPAAGVELVSSPHNGQSTSRGLIRIKSGAEIAPKATSLTLSKSASPSPVASCFCDTELYSVDTRAYHDIPGPDPIDPGALFKSDKVLVAIRAEKAGVIERGLAKLDAGTRQWLYTTTAENPEKEDWSITATAVRSEMKAIANRP